MTIINKANIPYLRAKIEKFEADSLTDKELLFFLLAFLKSEKQAASLTEEIISDVGRLSQLKFVPLCECQSWAEDESCFFKALIEFSRRVQKPGPLTLGQVYSSSAIGKYLQERLANVQQEVLCALYLNTKNEILNQRQVFKGTLNSANVHPREILHWGIHYSAARFLVAHNHPSGDLTPSKNDIEMTKRLVKCGRLIGIELLDHFIVSSKGYLSFCEQDLIGKA